MKGDEGASEEADAENRDPGTFRCLNCGRIGREGMDRCEECGTRYIWGDFEVPLDDSEASVGNDKMEDFEPIVEQKAVDCGYFDVASGKVAFTGPSCANKYELSECQNCATMIEVPVRSCPLCGGNTKKIVGGLGAVLSGALAWGSMNGESRTKVFCQSCGEIVAARNGKCELCGGNLIPQSESLSNPILRPMSAESVVFVHLNVESGEMSYLSEGERAASSDAVKDAPEGAGSAMDICTFERIGMMFDEQTSIILNLTSKGSMTASEICRKLEIPRSVCYRKLKTMTDARLLQLMRVDGESGEWHASRYSSNIDMAYVALEHGEMRMMMRLKDSKETQTQKFSSDVI